MSNTSRPRDCWNPGPLTKKMQMVLGRAQKAGGKVSFAGVGENGMKSFIKSLARRGLIKPDPETRGWVLGDNQ